jgi:hypothetical protein
VNLNKTISEAPVVLTNISPTELQEINDAANKSNGQIQVHAWERENDFVVRVDKNGGSK